MKLIKLRDNIEYTDNAAEWFSSKWDIPAEAYLESIRDCTDRKGAIPQWYIVVDNDDIIIAGAGVIENDFHDREDLSPNLCALYVEKNNRKLGIAKRILDFVRKDLGGMGVEKLYLVTDHNDFYEKCGWSFYVMAADNDGLPTRLYVADTL